MERKKLRHPARVAATAAALSAVLMAGLLASPAEAEEKTTRTYPGREHFRSECLAMGGQFYSFLHGTGCLWSDSSYTLCGVDWSAPDNCTWFHQFIVNRDPRRITTGAEPQRSATVETGGSGTSGGVTSSSSTSGRATMS